MNVLVLEFFGEPIAQKRHRTVRVGTFNRNYDPSKGDKADFLSVLQKRRPKTPLTGALWVDIDFYFSRPKSHFGTGRNEGVLKDAAPQFYTKKPDKDNLAKFVMDALTGVFYKDDSQVVTGTSSKHYTLGTPKTVVTIKSLENENIG